MWQPLSETAKRLKIGVYEHYKRGHYRVIGVARHSETGEEHVVYLELHGDYGFTIRPLAMFLEEVEVNGQTKPRFKFLHE